MKSNEMLSLYDFLGKAAGGSLGKAVADEAAKKKVKFKTKYVKNPAYEGEIMMYPKNFLEEYFNEKSFSDDLPF
jgi:Ran GTPase-activating protein (RanGAP) involved in mRNA processing and transport